MKRFRPYALIAVVVVVIVVLTVLISGDLRVRLIWGSSGFIAGLVCGVLLTLEVHHRRKKPRK